MQFAVNLIGYDRDAADIHDGLGFVVTSQFARKMRQILPTVAAPNPIT